MRANVRIEIRERGKLMGIREGHNVMVEGGRAWLGRTTALSSIGPDVPEDPARVRYMGVGIGGVSQGSIVAATTPPITTLYPVGFDPNVTTGNEYDDEYHINPAISTLERPIKISGSTTEPYATAPPSDVWLITDASGRFFSTHQTLTSVTFHGRVYGSETMLGGFFSELPFSEVGLFTNSLDVSKNIPYSPLVAYFSFDTIPKTADNDVEFMWSFRF